MILSKKHKFVFVKGKKVAGTSLEVLLSSICGPEDIITPITPIDELYRIKNSRRFAQNYGAKIDAHNDFISSFKTLPKNEIINIKKPKSTFYNHMPYCEILNLYEKISCDWIVFAVERCPYQKIISFANWQLNLEQYKKNGKPMASNFEVLKRQVYKLIENGNLTKVKNIDLYKDDEGFVKTQILRYERLEKDIEGLMSKLGINKYPKLQHFKKGMHAIKIDLHDILSSDQLKEINHLFKEEFELFGYEMFT